MAMKDLADQCEADDHGLWDNLRSFFTLQEDKCVEYYEHLMIDPIIKVPPTKVTSH